MSGTVARRQLARRLRLLRERAGLTLEDAAGRLECSSSRLGRIEKAQQGVDVQWVKGMLDLYDAGAEWGEMLDLARLARHRGWWRAYGLDDRGYVPLEASASGVREFTLTAVPGLLQTPEYARLAYVEHITGSVHLEKVEDVSRCSLAFDRLRSTALSPADSMVLLERLIAQR